MPSSQRFDIALRNEGGTRMTCVEADCAHERGGWVTVLDPNNDKHADALRWLHDDQGRKFIELRSEDAADWIANHGDSRGVAESGQLAALAERTPAGLLMLVFPPGQQCLRPHVDREVVFTHQVQDRLRVHARPADWNEHWNEEAYKARRELQRG